MPSTRLLTWVRVNARKPLVIICVCYLAASAIFGSVNLEGDERKFVLEPYQLLGGDYTRAYIAGGESGAALRCALKSYFFFWRYRPMFAPLIREDHKKIFEPEEERFGYEKASGASDASEVTLETYRKWQIVPEPDRWYHHGAGKPLLPAILTVPALGLVELVTRGGPTLLEYQFSENYHPVFILVRLPHILAGLISVLLMYRVLREREGERRAIVGSSIFALFPLSIQWFPNLHHDAIMVPFAIAATSAFLKERYVKSGIWYGLALASKNAAVLLLPALLFVMVGRLMTHKRSDDPLTYTRTLRRVACGLPLFLVVSLLVLAPFANPVSYMNEVLTPFTGREYDPRGEDVSSFSLSARTQDPLSSGEFKSVRRPEIMLLDGMNIVNAAFFFMILSSVLALRHASGDLLKVSVVMLLLIIPYQLVFGRPLNYRYLLFLPFFVFTLASLGKVKHLKWLLAFLVLVDVVMLIDPMTVGIQHTPAGAATFWESLFGSLGGR